MQKFLPFLLLSLLTSTFGAQVSFELEEDAYISSVASNLDWEDERGVAFGYTDPTLLKTGILYDCTWGCVPIGSRFILEKWDISNLPTNAQVSVSNLTHHTDNGGVCSGESAGPGGQRTDVYIADNFDEDSVTWNNKPGLGNKILSSYEDLVPAKLVLPLASWVQSHRANGNTHAYIMIDITNDIDCNFASSEHSNSSKRPTWSATYTV